MQVIMINQYQSTRNLIKTNAMTRNLATSIIGQTVCLSVAYFH